jgi:uncharacterized protein (DUF58 family)
MISLRLILGRLLAFITRQSRRKIETLSHPTNVEIKLNSYAWPILTGLVFVLQILCPDRVWTVVLIGLGGTWLIAALWARSLARNLHFEREIRFGWAQVGDHLQERFTLVNSGWAPALWAEIQDHSNLPDYRTSHVTSIGNYASRQWRTEGICTRRGLYMLGPTDLRTSDPFGIYSIRIHKPDSTVQMVMPPVVPLPFIEIAPGGRVGEGKRPRREAIETMVSSEGVREHLPGEALKAVHWPTSARKESLYVRQFEHASTSDWWIFLDLQAQVQIGEGYDSTEEHGVILAASLVDRGLHQGRAVGLVVCGHELVWLPPQRSSTQRIDILRALATVSSGTVSLEALLASQRQALRRGASLVVITPDVNTGWVKPLVHLAQYGVVPTVLMLDPDSFGGQTTSTPVIDLLADYGIQHSLITRDLINRPERRPGTQGQWEWRILGLGKAIPVRRPSEMGWRRLA